jgi:hypothetical protein
MADDDYPFSGFTGRGVRVGVIDSGVNPRHPHISSPPQGVSIGTVCDAAETESYLDILGHGTAVMAAIQEKAPDAEYFAVKVFHARLATKAALLFEAIEWCISQEMDVINLSLGTPNPDHLQTIANLSRAAFERGIVLVSAREVNGQSYLPGSLPGVIGVRLDWNCSRNSYRVEQLDKGLVFYASGYPRPLPGVPPERNLNGISFAVANMAGFMARACEGSRRAPKALEAALVAEASRHDRSRNGLDVEPDEPIAEP